MKRILGLIIALFLITGMASIGTWTFFIDAETSSANNLTAGTLDLNPLTSGTGNTGKYTVTAGGNGVNGNVVFTKMIPGESGSVTWVLTNDGSLSGTLDITSTATYSDGAAPNEVEAMVSSNDGGGNGDLDEYVGVKLQYGAGTDQSSAEASFAYILGSASNYVPLSGLEAILDAESRAMSASGSNDTIVYKLSWNLANPLKGAGIDGLFGTGDDTAIDYNIIQGDSAQIDITFTLNQ